MNEERRIQLVAEVDTTQTRAGFNEIDQQAGTMAASVTRSGEQAERAVSGIGGGADRSARAVEAAQRNLIGSIQRTTAAMEAGGRSGAAYYEVLARQRGVDPAVLAPYLAQLRAVEAAQVSANNALGAAQPALARVGVSAAQTAAALRGVPAQFTDIVTSIQGGQAPLTVFLQQGGQLRDMFGSAGGAARALGGYIVGLINPFTVAAAAAVALAVAYDQGASEAQAFNRALIVSGNAAGTTAGQLADMSRAIKESTGGTQGAAAAALAALAGTGRVSVANLREFATVAAQAQKAAVQGVDETAKAFANLGKAPLQTSLQLNEQYRFLTGSLYAQIKALQDQGREEEAAEAAQKAYASALADRSTQMVNNLGIAERAWLGIKGAAKGAWDAMLDVGRAETPEAEIARLQAKIAKASKPLPVAAGKDVGSVLFAQQQERFSGREEARGNLDADKARLALLQGQVDTSQRLAAMAAGRAQFDQADLEWSKQITSNLSRQEQLKNELRANEVRGLAAGASDSAINDEAIKIRKKYSDIFNDGIDSQIEAIKRRGELEDTVAKRSLDLLTANRAQGLISEEAYTEGVAQFELAAFTKRKQRLQEELTLTAGKQNSQKDQAALRGQIAAADEAAITREMQLTNDLNTIRSKGEQDIVKQIRASVLQRTTLNNSLEVEYQLYGKTADARELAMVSIKSEADLQKKIADAIALKKPLTEDQIARLRQEKDALDEVTKSVTAQTKALGYAQQLSDANKRFSAESIADEKQRAAALLEIDAAVWRERIALAGEGTEAQKKLQAEFDTWYANRQMAPVLDQWKKVISNLDDNFQTGFRDMLTSGENTWSSFTKSISNTLKTALADALYQTFVKKYVVQVVSSIAGGISGGDVASALGGSSAGGGGSTFGTALNLLSIGKTIYSGFAGGIASSLGGSISSLGSMFGSQAVNAFGLGMQGGLSGAMAAAGPGATATSSAAASAGAGAAGAIPVIGWIIAGMMASKGLYAQGWDAHNGSVNQIGLAAGGRVALQSDTWLQKLGFSAVGANILSGQATIAKLFGRANPVLKDQALEGTINSSGIDARNTATIFQKGGWFRSDKSTPVSAALDSGTDQTFDKTIQQMIAAVKGFGGAIGEQTTQIDAYTKSFKVALTGDAAKDQEAVTKLFSDVGNELSTLLVPSLSKLTLEGESASTALQRLAGDYATMDASLSAIGLKFGAVGASSLEAREKLISLSGGISSFVSQAESFSSNYLTEAERTTAVTKALDAAMAGLGLTTLPKTRDEFKALIQGLDLTTEPNQKLYAGLMSLSEAFASVHEASRSSADILSERASLQQQYDQLTMTSTQLLTKQRAALDVTNRALFDQIQALNGVSAAQGALQSAYEKQKASLQSVVDLQNAAADATQRQIDSLKLGTLSSLTPEQKYQEAQRQFDAAAPGDAKNTAAQALLQASRDFNGSTEAYARDYAKVQSVLVMQVASQRSAASVAQQQLAALDLQVGELIDINGGVLALNNTMASLQKAILELGTSMLALAAANGAAGKPSDALAGKGNSAILGVVEGLYGSLLGRKGEQAGLDHWLSQVQGGLTYDQLVAAFMGSNEYKALHGSHAAGLDFVPFDGYRAELHYGEEVKSAARVASDRNANVQIVKLLGDLVAELQADKEQRGAVAVATLKKLDTVAGNLAATKRELARA